MCGIVGFTGNQNAAPILLDGLKKLEYRGYDSAGIAVLGEEGIHMVKASGRIQNLVEKTQDGAALPGSTGIGHTRWATHGEPTDVNAHPHMSNDEKIAIVHNGIIENYAQLREELQAKGFQFKSDTDTEVVAHLMDLYYEGDLKKAVLKTISRLEGAYALGILCAEEKGRIIAARHAAPLIVGVGIGENYFASDVTALVAYTKNVIYLEDGEIADITPESVTVYDSLGKAQEKTVTRIAWDIAAAEKGGYDHFMLKEIMEQPKAVADTVKPRIKNDAVVFEDNGLTDERLREIEHIHIIGCGSALHAGMVGKRVIEAMCRIRCTAEVASEFRYENPIIGKKDMCIVISQSGETADTLAAMRLAKQAGAFTIAIVNVVSSTIAREADGVLYTWAGPEISVATTKAYSAQLSALYLISVKIARVRGLISIGDERALCAELQRLPDPEMPVGYAAHRNAVREPLERVLPWPRAGLCRRARGFAQAEGNFLYSFGGVRCR